MEGETTDLEVPTAASSSSSSPPALLRHVQAAFKRHRPLVTIQSNSIRPRRILVPQREGCINCSEFPPPHTGNSVSAPEQPVLCPPGVPTTSDESPDPSDCHKSMSSPTEENEPNPTAISSHGDFHELSAVDCPEDNFTTKKATVCTETCRDAGAPECSLYVTEQSSEEKNYYGGENPKAGVYPLPTNQEDRHNLNNPEQLISAVRSSSATATTLVNSSTAPAAISTTDCSLSFQEDPSHGSPVPQTRCGEAVFVPDSRNSSQAAALKEPKGAEVKPGKQEKGEGSRGRPSRKKNHDSDMFFKVNGKLYQKLGKIGSGGSSEVHKVISADCSIYALKKIKLKGRDYGTAYGFCQEIEYLNRLKGKKNIIQLIDYEVTDKTLFEQVVKGAANAKDSKVKEDGHIYMVLEYGEIDLAHMLSQKWKELDELGQEIDENWLRFFWQQILLAVNTIHEERIVHSDLKPANFLLVKGSLKLIDFGIAKAIMNDTTNIQRDSQVGTLSYMSPEAFMCNERDEEGRVIKCGRASDIWSLGCILYQMVYGRTPFSEYKTFWAKFKVITDRNHRITYDPVPNPSLLHLMHTCLAWDPPLRWRIPDLLLHPFIRPPPLPPSDLSAACLHLHHFISSSPSLLSSFDHLLSSLSDLSLSIRLSPPP